ncbi:MAG: lactate racemase domain-containing protein, partial [Chloroflexi bacterium]|nr:lactate racemase domain-containing protein [Chloroflexota bacterium]
TMSQVEVLYGDDKLRFEVPEDNLAGVVEPRLPEPLPDVSKAVAQAIENPVAGPKFSELIGPGKKVAILSDNFARPTPAHQILPPILDAVKKAGAEPRIIIGNGGIREMTEEELERKLGADILDSSIPVIQSQAKKRDDFEFIGLTRYGTPIAVNKYFLECDASIRVGTTQLNLWSGYGGGGSIVLPGLASFETIEWNHRLITARGSQIGTTMPENVMHADIEDAARVAGLKMGVNVILNPKWEVLDVRAGECVASHASSIQRYNEIYGCKAVGLGGKPGDIAISGSFPWDFYFAHACWSVATLDKVIKDGGTIIVASPSLGGLAHFAHVKDYMPPNKENQGRLLHDIFYGRQELWHAALWYPIYEVMMRKQVFVVTGEKNLGAFAEAGIRPFTSMDEALEVALHRH